MTRERRREAAGARVLAAALAHHRAGRRAEAEALYRRVLRQRPGHADALHLLGVLHAQAGRLDEALPLLAKATRRAPRNAGFLNDFANALKSAGRLDEAIAAYRRAAALDRRNADIRCNLGQALRAAGRPGEAVEWLRAALSIRPDHRPARAGLGHALLELARFGDAVDAFREAVAVDDSAAAHANLGAALRESGAPEEAEASLRRALARDPDHAAAHANLGNVLQDLNRLEEAVAAYRRALALDADYATAHANLGNTLTRMGRLDEAVASGERAVALKPGSDGFLSNLGMTHVARGAHDAALACFARATERRHGPPLTAEALAGRGGGTAPVPVAPFKLRHDAEQIRHLCESGCIDSRFARVAEVYERVLAALPPDIAPGEPLTLAAADWRRIEPTYNRPLHAPGAVRCAAAINPALDGRAIERTYRESAPSLAVVDDFLAAAALERLWRFCLEATVWYQVKRGYLGAYLVDGFGTALALQIADELRQRLPGIFRGHRLNQLWAYKYDSRLQGIPTHADFAAVNVNFWLTPDAANRNPDGGGLIVHKARAPSDWAFRAYNADSTRMARFLAEHGGETVAIPYRRNRAVIFDSDLFHRTADLAFHPGYENRRINVTMLFGDRRGD